MDKKATVKVRAERLLAAHSEGLINGNVDEERVKDRIALLCDVLGIEPSKVFNDPKKYVLKFAPELLAVDYLNLS